MNGSIATLRRCLKITQKQLAELANCKVSTIQRIEYGSLKMSKVIAARIAIRTEAGFEWLMSGKGGRNVRASSGQAIVADELERIRRGLRSPPLLRSEFTVIRSGYLEACYRLAKVLLAACEQGAHHTCLLDVDTLLREMEGEYGIPSSVLARRISPGLIVKDQKGTKSITFDMREMLRTFDETLCKVAPKSFDRRMG